MASRRTPLRSPSLLSVVMHSTRHSIVNSEVGMAHKLPLASREWLEIQAHLGSFVGIRRLWSRLVAPALEP